MNARYKALIHDAGTTRATAVEYKMRNKDAKCQLARLTLTSCYYSHLGPLPDYVIVISTTEKKRLCCRGKFRIGEQLSPTDAAPLQRGVVLVAEPANHSLCGTGAGMSTLTRDRRAHIGICSLDGTHRVTGVCCQKFCSCKCD